MSVGIERGGSKPYSMDRLVREGRQREAVHGKWISTCVVRNEVLLSRGGEGVAAVGRVTGGSIIGKRCLSDRRRSRCDRARRLGSFQLQYCVCGSGI